MSDGLDIDVCETKLSEDDTATVTSNILDRPIFDAKSFEGLSELEKGIRKREAFTAMFKLGSHEERTTER